MSQSTSYLKYLKYKAKYLELKQALEGGGNGKCELTCKGMLGKRCTGFTTAYPTGADTSKYGNKSGTYSTGGVVNTNDKNCICGHEDGMHPNK